jgi:hypothetical protein
MLSTHVWNANFTVQLLCRTRWHDEKSQSLLDKLNNEVKHFNGSTGRKLRTAAQPLMGNTRGTDNTGIAREREQQ